MESDCDYPDGCSEDRNEGETAGPLQSLHGILSLFWSLGAHLERLCSVITAGASSQLHVWSVGVCLPPVYPRWLGWARSNKHFSGNSKVTSHRKWRAEDSQSARAFYLSILFSSLFLFFDSLWTQSWLALPHCFIFVEAILHLARARYNCSWHFLIAAVILIIHGT